MNWIAYLFSGILFGFADWFFVQALQERRQLLSENFPFAAAFLSIMNFLVWILPLLPVISDTARRYKRCWVSGGAASLVWAAAMLSYYGWGAYQMASGKLPGWGHLNMHLSSPSEYQGKVWPTVIAVMGGEFKEWIAFAIISGFFAGVILCAIFRLGRQGQAS